MDQSEDSDRKSEEVDEERRDALRRLSRYGAYTAPALLVMLTSQKAPAQSDASSPS
jgi:hypothetical protein